MKPIDKIVIGRRVKVSIDDLGINDIDAKVDTGAYSSSIWASEAYVEDDCLKVVFFDRKSPHFDGITHTFKKNSYSMVEIKNSFGEIEKRYKISLKIKIRDKKILATFTLSDRSKMRHSMLLGRRVLLGKFIVDVDIYDKRSKLSLERNNQKINRQDESL
jgi:hypothetical protein